MDTGRLRSAGRPSRSQHRRSPQEALSAFIGKPEFWHLTDNGSAPLATLPQEWILPLLQTWTLSMQLSTSGR